MVMVRMTVAIARGVMIGSPIGRRGRDVVILFDDHGPLDNGRSGRGRRGSRGVLLHRGNHRVMHSLAMHQDHVLHIRRLLNTILPDLVDTHVRADAAL